MLDSMVYGTDTNLGSGTNWTAGKNLVFPRNRQENLQERTQISSRDASRPVVTCIERSLLSDPCFSFQITVLT